MTRPIKISHLHLVARWSSCVLPVLLAACWVDFPDSRMARPPDLRIDQTVSVPDLPVVPPGDARREAAGDRGADIGSVDRRLVDLPRADQTSCAPGAFLACNGKDMEKCNATGNGKVTVSCGPPGKCDSTAKRCDECDPKTYAPTCPTSTTLKTCSADGLFVTTTCAGGCQAGKCCVDADVDQYSTCTGDCNDGNKDVHPNQAAFFTAPIPGSSSYDYNCSNTEEKQWPNPVNCQVSGSTCVGDGWTGGVPACGQNGTWAACSKQGSCVTTPSTKQQACH